MDDLSADLPAACECGSWWFELKVDEDEAVRQGVLPAVTLTRDGEVTGHTGDFFCLDCGKLFDREAGRLRLVK